jgi:hypothetical protein
VVTPEGVHEVVTHDEKLEDALNKGASTGLPPNKTMGWLGEVGPDLRKVDEFEPSLNAGLSQESSENLRWLLMLILYLTGLGSPVALWLVWKEPERSLRTKIITTLVGVVGYVIAFVAYGSTHA